MTSGALVLLSAALATGAGPRNNPRQQAVAAQITQTQADSAEAETALTQAGIPEADHGPQVNLNSFHSTWPKILERVAEQSGCILIMDKVPPGAWSRRDKNNYPLADALKILNRDLEPAGFRLIKKGNYLVLVDLAIIRPEYRRPLIPPKPEQQAADNAETAEEETDEAADPSNGKMQLVGGTAPRRNRSRPPAPNLTPEQQAAPPAAAPARKEIMLSVATRHQTALALASTIYKAFKPNAELLNAGPQGLPAFRAVRPPAEPVAAGVAPGLAANGFLVGIDQNRNELIVQGSEDQARAVVKLIHRLDVRRDPSNNDIRIVTSRHDVERLATIIQPELNRLVEGLEQEQASNVGNLLTQVDPAAEPQDAPPGSNPDAPAAEPRTQSVPVGPEAGAELSELIRGLRTQVNVDYVPDLGALIITGNQRDVEAVMQIIKQLEQLSVGTTPDLHVLFLKHANSEALAEILTSVYDRLSTIRQRVVQQTSGVTFFPLTKPNAILILASANDMDSILKLAEELDQPVDPQSEFRVFRLKSAVASQAVTTITTFYTDRLGLGPRVNAVADVRTNSVVVYARARDLVEVAALIRGLDQSDTAAVNEMKMFPLKNALADELADVLQSSIQSVLNPARTTTGGQGGGGILGGLDGGTGLGAGQGSAALREVKSTVLEFLSSDGRQERLLRSGILADIRVNSDARTNTLIVSAPAESMELLGELIKQLDRPASMVAEIKVFSLVNGDATSMSTLLQTLFVQQQQQQQGQQLGVQLVGAEDASSGIIPLKFSVDSRTNSIIAVGGADALRVVEAILLRLDEGDVRQRKTVVFRLKNSPVTNVAQAVNDFLTSRRTIEQSAVGLVSPFEQIEREVIVVPETVSNTLLISATDKYFDEIRDIVTRLDEPPAQVIIQALIVEVTLDNTDEFGIEFGFQDSILFDRSVIDQLVTLTTTNTAPNGVQTTTQNIISQTAVPGFLFNNQQLGNNVAVHPSKVGTQGLSSFSLGRVNNDLGYGGLVLAAGSEGVSLLLRALAARRRVDILSRPQIRTLDNQLALIQVGQVVPVVNGVNVTAIGSANPVVVQDDAGIILQVTPRISPDGSVVMVVGAEKSAFQPTDSGVPIFTDVTTGQVIRAPIKDITTAQATVSVRSEQTVVLGGMITKSATRVERKVPWLGDIPYLGLPFRYDFTNTVRTELLIFLTPRIIRNDADSEMIKQIEIQRMHYVESEAEQIHGPIIGVPVGGEFGPGGMGPGPLGPVPLGPDGCPLPGTTWQPVPEDQVPTTIMPEYLPPPDGRPYNGLDGSILPPGATPVTPPPPPTTGQKPKRSFLRPVLFTRSKT